MPIQDSSSQLEDLRLGRQDIFYLKTDLPVPNELLQGLNASAEGELIAYLPRVSKLAAELGFAGTVEPVSSGSFHLIYKLTLTEKPPIVFRITRSDIMSQDDGLLLERWVHTWLARKGLANFVPETFAIGFRKSGAPFDYAIQACARHIGLRDLGDAVLDEEPAYLLSLGEALRVVHELEGDKAGLIDCSRNGPGERPVGLHACWADYLELRLEEHVRLCHEARLLDSRQSDRILRIFETLLPALGTRPLRLLHGDPGVSNVFVDPRCRRVVTLLDWEDALVGDPLFEVAMVSTFQPPRRMGAFLAGYGLSQPSLDEARLIALYYLRIALSKTVHRLRFATPDLPGRIPGHHRLYHGLAELERLL